jgi:hypothetical protein
MALLMLVTSPVHQGLSLSAIAMRSAPSRPQPEIAWESRVHSGDEAPLLDIHYPDVDNQMLDIDVLEEARRAYYGGEQWASMQLDVDDIEPLEYGHFDYELGAFSLAADARQ